jgi:predicted phage terminase large subunit-like protein
MGKRKDKTYVILDVVFLRKRADAVRKAVKNTATADGKKVKISLPQDPGQAGKEQFASYVSWLAGYQLVKDNESGDKETRAGTFAAQWQGGKVSVVKAPWNAEFFHQMEGFVTPGIHDDAVDACSGAFARVNKATSMLDVVN